MTNPVGGEVSMFSKFVLSIAIGVTALVFMFSSEFVRAQGKAADAKGFRCVFPLNATGTWIKAGSPEAAVKPANLVLRFDTINTDEGTARLRNGSEGSGVTVQSAGGNLHFMQSFSSGPLYFTTVFDKETTTGKFKAVHSRHEYFSVPLEGATSSPEQYYGECETMK